MDKNYTLPKNEIENISELFEDVCLNAPEKSQLIKNEPSQNVVNNVINFAMAYEPVKSEIHQDSGVILN